MSEPVVIGPGAGEVVGDTPDRRVEILCDHAALHATWSRFGPRRAGADLHIHHRHTDFFYVLTGELTVLLGPDGDAVAVPAGTLARVPPLVVHGFRNDTDAELRYLNFHAPGEGFADFMRGLRDGRDVPFDQDAPPADGGRPASEAVVGGAGPVLADLEAIRISEVRLDAGSPARSVSGLAWLYVLDGELEIGSERAPAGSWVQLPEAASRELRCPRPVRYLELRAPRQVRPA